jgi:hypothetical protein
MHPAAFYCKLAFLETGQCVTVINTFYYSANNLGRVLGPLVGGSILAHRLQSNVQRYAPTLDSSIAKQVLHRYTTVWSQVPFALRADVLHACSLSMTATYYAAMSFAVLSLVACLFGKWRRLPV